MKTTFVRWTALAVVTSLLLGCGGAEDRKARYLEKGEKFLAQRNFEKARVEFRNALQIDPNDPQSRYQVGRVAEKLNSPREAVGHYQAALDADPTHMPSRVALARLFLLGGMPDKATALVDPGLTQEPQNAQLLTVRGAAKAQLGNMEGAFEDAESAIKLAPDDEYAVALLASLYRQSARSDKAIEVVRTGIEHIPQSVDLRVVLAELELAQDHPQAAEEQLKKVIELQPKELPHRYRLARLYLLTKDVPAAERTMRETVVAIPDSIEAKVALVDLLAAQRGFETAEAELKKFAAEDDDHSPDLQLALAKFYEAHGKVESATRTYREIIESEETEPAGLTARNRLAALLIQQQKVDEAATLIDAVLKENARDNDALVLRGNLALARGDAQAAITDLRAVLRDQPNSAIVKRALARAHLQNNELALAEETLRSAAETSPEDRNVRLELAQLLMQSGRAEQARPLLEQLVSETPTDISALEQLFRVQAAQRDLKAAHLSAEAIKRMRPDLPMGWYLEGTLFEAEKDFDAAITAYDRALKLQPGAAEPLTAVVRAELAQRNVDAAMARLDQAVAEQPDNVVAFNLRGELLTARGESDRAIESFNSAIAKAPKWWMPYRGVALAQLAAKRTDAAIDSLERGLSITGAAALGTDLAALYERLNRPEDAIRVYESMVSRDPSSVAAANNLAMLLVSYRTDQSSLDRAQQLTGQLDHVTEPAVLNTRGWVKFRRGEFQDSLTLLQQAVSKAPDSPLMRYHLGMAQWRTGDRSGARQNLEAALTSGSQFHGRKEAQAALEEIKRAG